ncbi:MAG TPA: TetR family transcriptional regulator [Acidimicrobiales bacterium]
MLKSEATRERILAAARTAFAERGFGATSLRSIADAAGVDPALTIHYFGSKASLFVAAVQPPLDPASLFATIPTDPDGAGTRLAAAFLTALDNEHVRGSLLGILRTAVADEATADMMRAMVAERVVAPAVEALGVDHPDLRATLVGSQLIGLVFARYVLAVEPLASATTDTLVAAVGPTIQRYLTGELS